MIDFFCSFYSFIQMFEPFHKICSSLQRTLVETNPYLLGLTIIVSIVHSVFEFLAFKNGKVPVFYIHSKMNVGLGATCWLKSAELSMSTGFLLLCAHIMVFFLLFCK
jgi:hypothetical protein